MTDVPSPLLTASPDSITALFEADPLTLSGADLMRLILELRRRRNAFASEEAAKALKPKATRTKASPEAVTRAPILDKPITELGLDDLLGGSGS